MQSVLINPKITKDKIISLESYLSFSNLHEFIVYSDNILEGVALLNDLTLDDEIMSLFAVVYEPIDQPIYVFVDKNDNKYGIKVCGAYGKWELPKEVSQIINYIDLPDYVLYSINNKRVILAGENTETASVGNSQWQREGRKLGAARIGVPFIYQTFYSGRDESQDTIREPSSLQVYNHLVYSARYKTPSFVAYFENNFENSKTRERTPVDAKRLFSDYIKSVIYVDANPLDVDLRTEYEKRLYLHMIDYLREPKYKDLGRKNCGPRLYKDLPSINQNVDEEVLFNTSEFVDGMIDYICEEDINLAESYLEKTELLNFEETKFRPWKSYNKKKHICNLIDYLQKNNACPESYIGSAKIGFVDTLLCKEYFIDKFPKNRARICDILNDKAYPQSILMPLRIHKYLTDV